jgi:hypothetical protein
MENKIDRIQHSDYSTPIISKRKLIQCISGHFKLDIFVFLYKIVIETNTAKENKSTFHHFSAKIVKNGKILLEI